MLARHARQAARGLAARALSGHTPEAMRFGNPLGLPALPLPPLDDTLDRYLASARPVVSPEAFAETERVVEGFRTDEGPDLHASLQARLAAAAPNTYPFSYIEEAWDNMYLGGRWSIGINSNPYFSLTEVPAASLVASLVRWHRTTQDGSFPADSPPQCMTQYPLQFGTGRVAAKGRDKLTFAPHSEHVVVVRGGRYFRVGVGAQPDESALQARLEAVRAAADALPPLTGDGDAGLFTALERDAAAALRGAVAGASAENASHLATLDDALLIIVLDRATPTSMEEAGQRLLFAPGDRYFDKHQLIVFDNGVMGLNFEHSYSDGTTWNRMLTDSYADLRPAASTSKATTEAQELVFRNLPAAPEAVAYSHAQAESVGLRFLSFAGYGKETIKGWKMSPDAAVQVAFQLAYTRLHGATPPTYESCAMRSFLHGRTSTIRSATSASAAFCAHVLECGATPAASELLREAAAAHVAFAKQAQAGGDVDRPLLGLKHECEKLGWPLPALFTDPTYAAASTWLLSTSSITNPAVTSFGFGPVAAGGYGIGYSVFGDRVTATLSSFSGSPDTDVGAFQEGVAQALEDLGEIQSSPLP